MPDTGGTIEVQVWRIKNLPLPNIVDLDAKPANGAQDRMRTRSSLASTHKNRYAVLQATALFAYRSDGESLRCSSLRHLVEPCKDWRRSHGHRSRDALRRVVDVRGREANPRSNDASVLSSRSDVYYPLEAGMSSARRRATSVLEKYIQQTAEIPAPSPARMASSDRTHSASRASSTRSASAAPSALVVPTVPSRFPPPPPSISSRQSDTIGTMSPAKSESRFDSWETSSTASYDTARPSAPPRTPAVSPSPTPDQETDVLRTRASSVSTLR
jgi:hypothetical protein